MNGLTKCIVCKTPVDSHTGVSTQDGLVHGNPCFQKYLEMKKVNENKVNESKSNKTLTEELIPITLLVD